MTGTAPDGDVDGADTEGGGGVRWSYVREKKA